MPRNPAVVVNNAVQVALYFSLGTGTAMVNVLNAIKTGQVTVDQTLANALDTSIKSAWSSNLGVHCASNCVFGFCTVRDLSAPSLPAFTGSGATVQGAGVGDLLPGASACVVSLRTALAGHRYRGRVYLGGFTEAENLVSGTISAAVQAACASFVQAVDTVLAGHTMRLAVLSRPAYAQTITHTTTDSAGNENITQYNRPARPGAITQVISINVRNGSWDSQRSRNAAGSGGTLYSRPNVVVYPGTT
jgi:hypothetical protein